MTWDDAWAAKVRMSIEDHGKERTVAEMIHQRIGDYDAFRDYQGIVFGRVLSWLDTVQTADLERIVAPRPLSAELVNSFSARVAGPDGLTLLDAAECWIYQHGLRHMGEIEHARGLVGLEGMTS